MGYLKRGIEGREKQEASEGERPAKMAKLNDHQEQDSKEVDNDQVTEEIPSKRQLIGFLLELFQLSKNLQLNARVKFVK